MKYREKIAEIIKKNGTYNGRSLSFDYYVVQPDDLATALIENGIGDIIEWKHRAEVAEEALLTACINLVKDEEDNVNMELLVRVVYTNYLRKAEKELTEEKKSGK